MLYVLLVIIAIGVCLASEAGQAFLGSLTKIAIVGAIIYVGFWAVMLVVAFFTTDTGKSFASESLQFVEGVAIIAGLYYGGNYLMNEKKRNGLKERIKESYRKDRTTFIVWGTILGIIVGAAIFPYLASIYYGS